jgi:hypothetical protein
MSNSQALPIMTKPMPRKAPAKKPDDSKTSRKAAISGVAISKGGRKNRFVWQPGDLEFLSAETKKPK